MNLWGFDNSVLDSLEKRWQIFHAAAADDPKAVDAHYRMGVIHEYFGRLGEARAAFDRYVNQGGPKADQVERRIERLLRRETR